jgi:uncharacterized protein (DUF433 family)
MGTSRAHLTDSLQPVGRFSPNWTLRNVLARHLTRDNRGVTEAITRNSEIMHGVPVFRGTRVPVQTLFEYLEGGESLDDFLQGFPTVSRSLALQALAEARQLLLSRAS